jgi:hypothetical protein
VYSLGGSNCSNGSSLILKIALYYENLSSILNPLREIICNYSSTFYKKLFSLVELKHWEISSNNYRLFSKMSNSDDNLNRA